jgi:arylsulfatase B
VIALAVLLLGLFGPGAAKAAAAAAASRAKPNLVLILADDLGCGFDDFFGLLDGGHRYFGEDPEFPFNAIFRGFRRSPEPQYLTGAFAREAASFIHRHAGRPFFLYLAFNATHLPLEAEPRMLARFASIRDIKRRYFAAMLAHLDEAVGAVRQAIRDDALEENTLLVFLTDNGCITTKSSCQNRPLRRGKGSLYEGGMRVPLLLSWPGTIVPGQTYTHPVSALDLFPTLLAAATGTAYSSPRLDGVSLLPVVTGGSSKPPHDHLFWGWRQRGSVRQGDWKLIEQPSKPVELYNLRDDVSESRNLAAAHPTIVAELRRARAAWVRPLPPPFWPCPLDWCS